MEWRLIIHPPGRGAWNMAVDEALAEAVDQGASGPVLRLYRWTPPCLTLGASQPFDAADAPFCAANGIDVVRRPTGGRAVLHHLELTYLVAARLGEGAFSHDLQAAYRKMCQGLVAGLRRLGVPAELSGTPTEGNIRPTEPIPCFMGPAAGEVVVGGRKLVGSAMRRVGNAVLQHGAILEGWDSKLQAGCLGLADDSTLRPAVVTLAEVLDEPVEDQTLLGAIAKGIAEELGAHWLSSTLTVAEGARAQLLERERYANPRWTAHRDRSLPE